MKTQQEINDEMNAQLSISNDEQASINKEMNAKAGLSNQGRTDTSNVPQGRTFNQMLSDTGQYTGDTATSFTTGFTQGVTAELGDEIEGIMDTVFDLDTYISDKSISDIYEGHRNDTRKRYAKNTEGSDVASGLGKLAGMIAPWSLLGKGADMLKTAALGGTQGGLEYIGSTENAADISAGKTAMWAALSAIPAEVVTGGTKVFRSIFGAKSKDQVADILQSLKDQSGLTEAEIMEEAFKMGGDLSSLVDSTGSGIAFAQGLLGTSQAGMRSRFEKHLAKTAEGKARIIGTMEEVTGKGNGQYFASLNTLKQNRRDTADKMYGAALDESRFEVTPAMTRIMNRNPTVKEAWEQLQNKYADRGVDLPGWGQTVDGKLVEPDVGFSLPGRVMQEFKWEMDKLVRDSSQGVEAGSKKMNRLIADDRDAMMEHMYKQNSDFKAANAAYAGDSAMIEAQEAGYKHGLGGEKLSIQLNDISKLSQSEKDAYLQGVMSRVYDKLGASPENVLGSVNRIANENSMEVLTALTNKQNAAKILNSISSEKRFRSVENQLLQGSQTELRQTAKEAFQNISDRESRGIVDELTNVAKEIPYLKQIRREMMGIQQLSNAQRNEIADLILQPGGVQKALERLKNSGQTADEASKIIAILRGVSASPAQMYNEEQ